DGRLSTLDLFQVSRRGKKEDAAVPEVHSGLHPRLRRSSIGLLHEAVELEAPGKAGKWVTLSDVAVASVRSRGLDAKRHQPTVGGGNASSSHGLTEGGGVRDHVIGGHDEHCRVTFFLGEEQRGYRSSRCRVASDRLDDELPRGHAELPELLGQKEAVLFVPYH